MLHLFLSFQRLEELFEFFDEVYGSTDYGGLVTLFDHNPKKIKQRNKISTVYILVQSTYVPSARKTAALENGAPLNTRSSASDGCVLRRYVSSSGSPPPPCSCTSSSVFSFFSPHSLLVRRLLLLWCNYSPGRNNY